MRRLQRNVWTMWLAAGLGLGFINLAQATEVVAPAGRAKSTQVILTVNSSQPVSVRSRAESEPPAIVLEFPSQQIVGLLPNRSTLHHGVIADIQARYRADGRRSTRTIESIRISLTGAYPYQVHTRPGQIVIEIEHPESVKGEAIEIGLSGGTILTGLTRATISERFRAMQEALTQATSTGPARRSARAADGSSASAGPSTAPPPPTSIAMAEPSAQAGASLSSSRSLGPSVLWGLVLLLAAATGLWILLQLVTVPRRSTPASVPTVAGGAALIDQLVWRAFERQGYQLVQAIDVAHPSGTLRVVTKEGMKVGLLCLVDGTFYEKHTIEQYVEALRAASLEQGFLAVSGSFTVPAQRAAKDARVTLIGRDQLMELLGSGAMNEYFSNQLETIQAKLNESKDALTQSTRELDLLRRQRNEASWFLGEERAKSATLEAEVAELSQQVRRSEEEVLRWQAEAAQLRKQWDESEWYLGEAKERLLHLEEQVSQLQTLAAAAAAAQQERDAAMMSAGDERGQREQLTAQLQALSDEIKQFVARERALRDQAEQLKAELEIFRTYGERRRRRRANIAEARVELRDEQGQVLFSGIPRDISSGGIGVDTEQELADATPVRVTLHMPGRDEPVSSAGRVVWRCQDPNTARFRTGCRFRRLPQESHAFLRQFLEAGSSS